MNKKIHIKLPLIYGVNNENIYVISKNKKWKVECDHNIYCKIKNKNITR